MSGDGSRSIELHGRWRTIAHTAWYVCAALTAIVLLAAVPVYYQRLASPITSDPYGLGQFNAPFQVLLEVSDLASSFISFILALLLFWRKPNDRMALFASFFFLFTSVAWSHSLDYFLTAYLVAPSTYHLWSSLSTPLAILLVSIFPNGRFVPRWTRWVFVLSIASTLSIFTGGDLLSIVLIAVFALFMLAAYAQVYRYRRVSNYTERQQTKWWLYGLFVSLMLSFIASVIFKQLGPPLFNVTPIFLTIAILRSRLWDIDIIIRRTVTYTILVAIWLLVYFGGVILAQQLFANITGQRSEVITVISTLAIAALFIPLRNRIQNTIDQRFYRKKYDAQQVLAKFAVTVRDETDLDKLTGELLDAVNETMQPKSASVWLKETPKRIKG